MDLPIDLAPSYIDRLPEGEGGGEGKGGGGERNPTGDMLGESVRASAGKAVCVCV